MFSDWGSPCQVVWGVDFNPGLTWQGRGGVNLQQLFSLGESQHEAGPEDITRRIRGLFFSQGLFPLVMSFIEFFPQMSLLAPWQFNLNECTNYIPMIWYFSKWQVGTCLKGNQGGAHLVRGIYLGRICFKIVQSPFICFSAWHEKLFIILVIHKDNLSP